jgi:hypothetical protein
VEHRIRKDDLAELETVTCEDSEDREACEELERQVQAELAELHALQVVGIQLGDMGPPWDLNVTPFPMLPEECGEDEGEAEEGDKDEETFVCWRFVFGSMTPADPRMVEATYGARESLCASRDVAPAPLP